eukprot:Plantae.Rhodophyta-Hildenbrandia_rubra.ctg32224.p2 GENE.Plantae.Rhodophyta-Hildenbrandia_rubra.ctg32224~~Plantae.Rhodophyta-Hildenbrandia_rubra.ctg32224.p2  ORF type:complete len:109 (+),score=13.11 Plantae.Rhodophyta-Hildenbrandia_rubra.ctg32224:1289-1615(+)
MTPTHALKHVLPLLLLILQTPILAAVTQFTIVDTSNSKDVGPLQSPVYTRADLPTTSTIRCDVTGGTKQAEFFIGGKKIRTEKGATYTISGDTNGAYRPWNAPMGKTL